MGLCGPCFFVKWWQELHPGNCRQVRVICSKHCVLCLVYYRVCHARCCVFFPVAILSTLLANWDQYFLTTSEGFAIGSFEAAGPSLPAGVAQHQQQQTKLPLVQPERVLGGPMLHLVCVLQTRRRLSGSWSSKADLNSPTAA